MDVVSIFMAMLFTSIAFVAVIVPCAYLVGLKIREIGFGCIIPLATWNVKGITINLKAIPYGSSVNFRDAVVPDEPEPVCELYFLPLLSFLFVIFTPHFVILLVGLALYFIHPGRTLDLMSLFWIWTGFAGLLPNPGGAGYFTILRIVTPRGQSPRLKPPTWLMVTAILLSFGTHLVVAWLLAFRGDNTLAVIERLFPR